MPENLRVIFLLHFYQPWWQYQSVLENIVNQCYRPVLDIVRGTDGFCFTANINLCLLEQLEKHFPDVIYRFREAVCANKIELMGSTAHHPIFPLISEKLQLAHLQEDDWGKKNNFGLERNCRGIYLPEMAFGIKDVGFLRNYGYRWTIIDDEPFSAFYGYVPYDQVISSSGFRLYMRSRYWSNMVSSGKVSFDDVKSRLNYELPNWTQNRPAYLIIAMDAETFGHHHPQLIDYFLKPMLAEWPKDRKVVSIRDIENEFPQAGSPVMPNGSWSTTRDDVVVMNDPYPLWKSRFNIHHSRMWDLVNGALVHFEDCRSECLQITSSCHWWWISGKPYWKPEFMKKGAQKAMDIIRQYGSTGEVVAIQDTYDQLMQL